MILSTVKMFLEIRIKLKSLISEYVVNMAMTDSFEEYYHWDGLTRRL